MFSKHNAQNKLNYLHDLVYNILGLNKSLQLTALFSMIDSFSSSIFSLLLIPVLTYNVGLNGYGLYVLIIAINGILGFSNLGVNSALTYHFGLALNGAEDSYLDRIFFTALSITILGTVTISAILLLALHWLSPFVVAKFPNIQPAMSLLYSAFILLIFNQINTVVSDAIRGLHEFKKSSITEFTICFCGFLILSTDAILFKNVSFFFYGLIGVAIISSIIRFFVLNTILNLRVFVFDFGIAKSLLHYGKWMTLQNISGMIFNAIDKILLGFLFSSYLVGVYNILISITQLSHFFLSRASTFIFPKVSGSRSSPTKLKQHYVKAYYISKIFIFLMISLTMILFFIFSRGEIRSFYREFLLLLFSYGLLAFTAPAYYFSLGLGKVRLLSCLNIISGLIASISLYFLVSKYAVMGAAASRLLFSLFALFSLLIPHRFFRAVKATHNY